MAYTSDIDLKISESPKTNDPALFPDMVDIYNALHILAQWVNQVVKQSGQGSGDETTPPWEAMTFDKWFYAPAAVDVTKGSIVTPFYSKVVRDYPGGPNRTVNGIILGAGAKYSEDGLESSRYNTRNNKGISCIAMNDAAAGELVQCGTGPAILEVPGLKMGQPVVAKKGVTAAEGFFGGGWQILNNDGQIYILPTSGSGIEWESYIPVGVGIANDAAMMFPAGYMDTQTYLPPQLPTGT